VQSLTKNIIGKIQSTRYKQKHNYYYAKITKTTSNIIYELKLNLGTKIKLK